MAQVKAPVLEKKQTPAVNYKSALAKLYKSHSLNRNVNNQSLMGKYAKPYLKWRLSTSKCKNCVSESSASFLNCLLKTGVHNIIIISMGKSGWEDEKKKMLTSAPLCIPTINPNFPLVKTYLLIIQTSIFKSWECISWQYFSPLQGRYEKILVLAYRQGAFKEYKVREEKVFIKRTMIPCSCSIQQHSHLQVVNKQKS